MSIYGKSLTTCLCVFLRACVCSSECVSDISPTSCDLVQSLLGPGRKLVCHGMARLQAGLQTQERYLFLFSDIFIIGKAK